MLPTDSPGNAASTVYRLDFQNRRLRQLVQHAYKAVPYYRKLFDQNGLEPEDIRTIADLPRIPVTSKRDLQGLPVEEVLAVGVSPRRLIVRFTSGSEGRPLRLARTVKEDRVLETLRRRALNDYGRRAMDRRAFVALPRESDRRFHRALAGLLRAAGLHRHLSIDCRRPLADIARDLRRFRPDIVIGYSGALARLARSQREALEGLRPRFVVTGSEVLTPLMRQQIQETFRAPVYQMYGAHEFCILAWECRQTGELHVCDDGLIVEVLRDGRPAREGERGELVGTNLHSFAMPFIRYRLGDIVTQGAKVCRCGLPFSTLRGVQGRMLDYFELPGGRAVHPYDIFTAKRLFAWVREFQIVQERADRVVFKAVPDREPSPSQLAAFRAETEALLGPDVQFELVLVPELTLDPSGKFRVARSLVKSEYDKIDWGSGP